MHNNLYITLAGLGPFFAPCDWAAWDIIIVDDCGWGADTRDKDSMPCCVCESNSDIFLKRFFPTNRVRNLTNKNKLTVHIKKIRQQHSNRGFMKNKIETGGVAKRGSHAHPWEPDTTMCCSRPKPWPSAQCLHWRPRLDMSRFILSAKTEII